MGKTALLLELADRANKLGFVVARVTASERMLDEIIEEIQNQGSRYVSDMGQKVKGVSAGALGFSFGLTFTEVTERQYGFRIKLSMLCERLAKQRKVFADAGVAIRADVLEELVQATMGYPYLMQLIGYNISQVCEGQESITADAAKTAIINAKRQLEETLFLPCLHPLSMKEMDFLKAMAVDHGPSSVKDIRQRMGVSSSYIQPYRKRLISAGAIDSPSKGFLEFRIPYLGEYLRGEI